MNVGFDTFSRNINYAIQLVTLLIITKDSIKMVIWFLSGINAPCSHLLIKEIHFLAFIYL
jgi:hypothetical protein